MADLWQAIQRMADTLHMVDTGNVWEHFTCTEIESIADVLRVAGRDEVAEFILAEHAEYDEPGDEHHIDRPQFEIVASFSDGIKRCGEIPSFPNRVMAEEKIAYWETLRPESKGTWWVREIKEEQQ